MAVNYSEHCFPYIGERTYVHSTSFIKYLISFYGKVKHLSIKFRKLSINNIYKFCSSTEPPAVVENVVGSVVCGSITYYYYFQEIGTIGIPTEIDPECNISNINTPYEFVDVIVTHSKSLCDDLYDPAIDFLYMAKIDISNFDDLSWPLMGITHKIKKTGSRIEVKYYYNNVQISHLLGLVRPK